MAYLDSISKKKRDYFKILCNKYIETKAMQRIGLISMDCGCDYSGLFKKHG